MSRNAFSLPLLEWLEIPAGEVTLEGTAGTFPVKPFQIARYPVTNAQFAAFIADGGYKQDVWWQGLAQKISAPRPSDWREADCPKLQVCWFEAVAFCRWLAHQTGLDVRLPTEWEWQWAAVGDSGWAYPYGSEFDSAKCSTKETGLARTNTVTTYTAVKTHFGTVDMAGNVWEWCLNAGDSLQGTQTEGSEKRIMRGGSWNNPQKNAQITFRSNRTPLTRMFNIGFRVVAVEHSD